MKRVRLLKELILNLFWKKKEKPTMEIKIKKEKIMNEREIATMIAVHYIGTFYKWGGDDPSGFDCSGLAIELLKSIGKFPRKEDRTALGLSNMFTKVAKPKEGCLVFYGNPISHVEYCYNENLSIGASGGGPKTLTVKDAIRQNAFIKMRPIRKDKVTCYVDPFVSIR